MASCSGCVLRLYTYINRSNNATFTLPVEAVIRNAKGATVLVKSGKNTFKNKMVEVGAEAGKRIEIKSDLQTGELAIITGAYLLNSEYIFKKQTQWKE